MRRSWGCILAQCQREIGLSSVCFQLSLGFKIHQITLNVIYTICTRYNNKIIKLCLGKYVLCGIIYITTLRARDKQEKEKPL